MSDPDTIFSSAISQALDLIWSWDAELMAIVLLIPSSHFQCGYCISSGYSTGRFIGYEHISWSMGFRDFCQCHDGFAARRDWSYALFIIFFLWPLWRFRASHTPTLMVIAQIILVAPIIAALSREAISGLYQEYAETLQAMRATRWLDTLDTYCGCPFRALNGLHCRPRAL